MKPPIKVAYVVSTLARCGPVKQLYFLIKNLDRSVFSPHIITLSVEPNDSLRDDFIHLVDSITTLGLSRLQGFLKGMTQYRQLTEELEPHVIHSQGFRADIATARLPSFCMKVSTQRNYPFEDYQMAYGKTSGWLMAHVHYWALKRIATCVACSRTIAEDNGRHKVKSVVIPNGTEIPPASQLKSSEQKRAARRVLQLPSEGRMFLFAGPLIARKSVDILIQTFLSQPLSDTNNTLCILGDGPLKAEILCLAEKNKRIIIRGKVENTSEYLSAADVLISASISEGLPNAVIEGLSWGLPVLLSDIPPHRMILDHNPLAGKLFTLNDPNHLAVLIRQSKISKESQNAARQIVIRNFSADTMSKNYQNLYQGLVSRNTRINQQICTISSFRNITNDS